MGSLSSESTWPPDFGRYHFLGVLGKGAIGTVYLVEDQELSRKAVMKIADGDMEPAARERFQNEVRVLQQFHHPSIPTLYDYGALPDGRLFLVTEWVDGSTLEELRQTGRAFSIRDALETARSLAAALGHAHERGVLHLDVKPPNILVPKVGGRYAFDHTKLIDFSVRGLLRPRTNTTVSGFMLGTPYYMSPEQFRADALTPAADIFSLGCVMYEMLSGRRPFKGDSVFELLSSVLQNEPEPMDPSVPSEIAALLQRCLAKDPRQRPASGKELESELARLLDRYVSEGGFETARAILPTSRVRSRPPSPPSDGGRLLEHRMCQASEPSGALFSLEYFWCSLESAAVQLSIAISPDAVSSWRRTSPPFSRAPRAAGLFR